MLLEKSQIGGSVSFPSVPHYLLLPEELQEVLFHLNADKIKGTAKAYTLKIIEY